MSFKSQECDVCGPRRCCTLSLRDYGKVIGETTEGVDRWFVSIAGAGPSPAHSAKLFSKVKGNSDQIVVTDIRSRMADPAVGYIKVFATVQESHPKSFSSWTCLHGQA